MSRYNHFAAIKNSVVYFKELKLGDKFSSRDRPFLINIKISESRYKIKRTGEVKEYAIPDLIQIYTKPTNP